MGCLQQRGFASAVRPEQQIEARLRLEDDVLVKSERVKLQALQDHKAKSVGWALGFLLRRASVAVGVKFSSDARVSRGQARRGEHPFLEGCVSVRVAIVSDCYFPTINGVVTSIKLQVDALRALGHHVDVYCPSYAKPFADDECTYRLAGFPFPFHKAEQVTLPWPPSTLRRFFTQQYDVFHLQTPFSMGLMGLAAAWWRGTPRVFHHHTLWEEYVDYLPVPKAATRTTSIAWCRWLAQRCQAVISPSQRVKERFAGQGVTTPISVVPTGIRAEDFQNGTPRQERGDGDEICLYVGRLAHEKSIDVVLRVFAQVYRQRPQARLWLVGDGPARAHLEQLAAELEIAEATRFFGFVARDSLKDYVASSKLFLFASETETQGLVVLEAQAGGLPVVAVRASGVDEAIDDGVSGFMVEPGDEAAMAQAALRLLGDVELYKKISRAAENWSAQFSVQQMGEALAQTYRSAIETA